MNPKLARASKTPAELRGELRDQVAFLQSYCQSYDAGDERWAKPISTALRLLLNQTKSSQSLLQQLGLRSGRFFTVAPPLNPRNMLSSCGLFGTSATVLEDGRIKTQFMPLLGANIGPHKRRIPFPEWWNNPVAKGPAGAVLSRRGIVSAVANTDGGAHVDPGLEPLYASFRSGEFFGISAGWQGQEKLIHSPQCACLRAIAHEVLLTLEQYAPNSFERPYAYVATGL